MRSIQVILLCAPMFLQAQSITSNENVSHNPVANKKQGGATGIQWIENQNWLQIRQAAKMENKFIFVDCYATWCAPCKKMDAETYSKKSVGDLFNNNFVAVKIQMDSTQNDPEHVKDKYKDAQTLKKEYFVFAFPTLLFFNPDGELVEKIVGFQDENQLISIAKISLAPGKKFEDPFKEFHILKDNYQKGKKDYQRFPYMISVARQTGQRQFAQDLLNELHRHLLKLSNEELLNRDYIQFITEYEYVNNKNADSNLSRIFVKEGKKVDALMQRVNFSREALNAMIRRGFVTKFLDKVTGKGLKQSKKDSMGFNVNALIPWDTLFSDIGRKFSSEIAEENVLWAKIRYFDVYKDSRALSCFLTFTKKYGVEATFLDALTRGYFINYIAWTYCVKRECDLNDIRYLSNLMKDVVEHSIAHAKISRSCHPPYSYIDTYALLLHKMGEQGKAIKSQTEAIDIYLHCGGGTWGDKQHKVMVGQLGKMQNPHVQFSGSWLLNTDKSKFNETPGKPAASMMLVDQRMGYITYKRNDRPMEQLKIDSTSFIEFSNEDFKIKVSIKHVAGNEGLIETRLYTYPEGKTGIVTAKKIRTWMMSTDKNTLTIWEHIETTRAGLCFDMQLVYDRQ